MKFVLSIDGITYLYAEYAISGRNKNQTKLWKDIKGLL